MSLGGPAVKIHLIIGLFLLGPSAMAELYLEPNVGYGFGNVSVAASTFSGSESMSAPTFGARLGVFFDYVFVGADVKASYLTLQGDKSNLMTTAGLGLSFTMDYIPMRIFTSLDLVNSAKFQGTEMTSFGYRIGVGYYVTENIVANLEMQSVKMSGSASTSSTSPTANLQGYFVTVSFPFTFDYPSTPWRERYRVHQGPSASDQPEKSGEEDAGDELMDDSLE